MKFKVIGAKKDDGEDVELVILAVSHADAERVAAAQGIMVSKIEPIQAEAVVMETIALEPESETPAVAAAAPAVPTGNGHAAPAPAAGHPEPHAETQHDPAAHESAHPDAHMNYKLLQNQALYLLEKTVNKFLAEGWEPTGGLSIAIQNNAPNYFQALIKRNR